MRTAGRCVVNFPRPGLNEVQAVRGEDDRVTLQRAAGKRAPPRIGPLPPAPEYKGVHVDASAQTAAVFVASFVVGGESKSLGYFCSAEEAARAYDDAARIAGRRVVNFLRPDTAEVQAVKGEKEEVTLQRAAGKRAPPRSGPLPPAPDYKGVSVEANARTAAVFVAAFKDGGVRNRLGYFCTAEEAACAYDDAMRTAGRCVVNFPRPGLNEVQAVKGERYDMTLARHVAAQQAAGGAGAAGTIAPPSMASSPSKRRAVGPPPSEPPRKRVSAHSVKPETPAAAAPEAPAAPAPYKRRPPHRIGPAASPPPDDGPAVGAPASGLKTESPTAVKPEAPAAQPPPQYKRCPPHRIERESSLPPGFVAPAAGIKTETPAAVKPEAPVAPRPARYTRRPPHRIETEASPPELDAPAAGVKLETATAIKPEMPAASPMPAVAAFGWASPAPPSAAAAAPPVKMERD